MSLEKMRLNWRKSLAAVTRKVSELGDKEGKPVRNVTLERSYSTDADDLWDAVTNPERLERFFGLVGGDLKLGGRYRIEGNAEGTITDCVPPKFFAATWEFGGELSWIEVHVVPEGEARSRLTIIHICPIDEHWEKYGPGSGGVGWDLVLIGLEAYLGDKTFDPSAGHAFMISDVGKAFMAGASEAWGQAAVASGENPVQAETAAKRTTAFYTGEESQEG